MPGQNLTREEAATRADLLAVSSYDVVLDLAGGPTTFATRSTVRFAATEGADTFIDFVGASVESVVLNGTRSTRPPTGPTRGSRCRAWRPTTS